MAYTDFIIEQLSGQTPGQPILFRSIVEKVKERYQMSDEKAKAATAVAIQRIQGKDTGLKLRTYQKGIYYLTEKTPFGEVGIDKDQLTALKYLFADKGYESGLSYLHRIGVTTQIPRVKELVTNCATSGRRYDAKLDVYIHPPKEKITADNLLYLQILDAMETMEKAPVDAENPYRILADQISRNHLHYQKLLALVGSYYSQKTLIQLTRTAQEGGTV